MSISRIYLFVTIGLGISVVASHWLFGLTIWTIMYAVIYAAVLIAELASYLIRGHTISTHYRNALKEAEGVKKWLLLLPPTLAVLTLVGLWVHLVWGAW